MKFTSLTHVITLVIDVPFQEFEKELKEEMKDDEMERKTENPEKKEV